MRKASPEFRTRARLSVQRAMLGEIFPALRALAISLNGKEIRLDAFVDGPVADDDFDSISCIGGEVIGDFSEEYTIREEITRLDAPARIPDLPDVDWV